MARTIAALGRPFELGMVYDSNTESLVVSDGLWYKETIDELKKIGAPEVRNTKFEFVREDKFSNKARVLDIRGSIKISILSGLVNVDGSGEYLHDSVKSSRQKRLSLHARYVTRFERIVNPAKKIDRPEVVNYKRGTHYVAGITYGANILFVFDKWDKEEKEKQDVAVSGNASLPVSVFGESVPGVTISGDIPVKVKNPLEDTIEGYKCTFYGDIKLKNIPLTPQEGEALVASLPDLVGDGVPILIHLEPIDWLRSEAGQVLQISQEINKVIVDQVSRFFEDLHTLSVRCSDLLNCSVCTTFPSLIKSISLCHELVSQQRQTASSKLKVILPKMRRGEIPERELEDFLRSLLSSPFAFSHVSKYLDAKERHIKALTPLCKYMPKEVVTISEPGAFENISCDPTYKYVVSYTVSAVPDLGYLENWQRFIENDEYTTEGTGRKLLEEEERILFDCSLTEKAILFKSFFESIRDAGNLAECKFIVMETQLVKNAAESASVEARIQMYKGNKLLHPDFIPVGKPGPLCKIENYHNQINVKWNQSKSSEAIRYYEVECRAKNEFSVTSTKTEAGGTEVSITNLQPGMSYVLRYRACVELGLSSWSDEAEVSTRRVGAPHIVTVSQKKDDELLFEWQKPWICEGTHLLFARVYMRRLGQCTWTELVATNIFDEDTPQTLLVKFPPSTSSSFKMITECSGDVVSADSNIVYYFHCLNDKHAHELNEVSINILSRMDSVDFTQNVNQQLMELERKATTAPEVFRDLLSKEAYCDYWKLIMENQSQYTPILLEDVRFYCSRLVDLAGETTFQHKENLILFISQNGKRNVGAANALHECAASEMYRNGRPHLVTLLSNIANSATVEPAILRLLLGHERFQGLFKHLVEESKNFVHDGNIQTNLGSILDTAGDQHFQRNEELKDAYMNEPARILSPLIVASLRDLPLNGPELARQRLARGEFTTTFKSFLEERAKLPRKMIRYVRNLLTNIIDVSGDTNFPEKENLIAAYMSEIPNDVSDILSMKDFLMYLSTVVKNSEDQEDPKTIAKSFDDAETAVLQVINDQNLYSDKVFLNLIQILLKAEVKNRSFHSALKCVCDFSIEKYMEFISAKDHGTVPLQCYLLNFAIESTEKHGPIIHTGDAATIDHFLDKTFENTILPLRENTTKEISSLLHKFTQKKPLDFEWLRHGLQLIQAEKFETVDKLDRLVIPKFQHPESSKQFQAREITIISTSKQNSETFLIDSMQDQINGMLKVLGLQREAKISMFDVLSLSKRRDAVASTSESSGPVYEAGISLSEVPIIMLRAILMLDFRGREEIFRKIILQKTTMSMTDMILAGKNFRQESNLANEKRMNPLDVLVLTYNCCHLMLRRVFLEKLFICKLAVPFVYRLLDGRYGISFWALGSIVAQCITDGKLTEKSVLNAAGDIKSFIRIGRPKSSKSKLLNHILCDEPYNTFFNRECAWGSLQKIVAEGMIEAAWYCPSGNVERNVLNRYTMALNLRGNALEHRRQAKFLCKTSSLLVALVSVEDLDTKETVEFLCNAVDSNESLTVVVLIDPVYECTDFMDVSPGLRNLLNNLTSKRLERIAFEYGFSENGQRESYSNLKVKIREHMNSHFLASMTLSRSIEVFGSQEIGFVLDEDEGNIKCTRKHAEEVFLYAKYKDEYIPCSDSNQNADDHVLELQAAKNLRLPLQGCHWKLYSQLKKEYSRKTDQEVRRKLHGKIANARYEQLALLIKHSESGNHLMTKFQWHLVQYTRNGEHDSLIYWLEWLRLYLDDHTREYLPAINKAYINAIEQLREEKRKHEPDAMKIKELEEDEKLRDLIRSESSFGLEHIMREIAQIYETVNDYYSGNDDQIKDLSDYEVLPLSAAMLLLRGFPLELMDGDAANVPITWIRSVLRHAQSMAGDKKIFILTVLGIQSSGKSTLLNTMFGLKFAIGAGRCTRGIFMQLLPVDRASGYNYDYVMVLDTEGLRSPELQGQHRDHDNELATLIIGLGDLTILNIKGENLSEVQDILEISVQAFLTMKIANAKLNLRKSCVFVHQNAGAIDNEEKMKAAHFALQKTLDDMTKVAARQAQSLEINSFNDVIKFLGKKNVFYFPDLWNGEPPMARANDAYSVQASKLRAIILDHVASHQEIFYSFSNFSDHAECLWNGIVSEDFLFNFRNNLEIEAYSQLDDFCSKLHFKIDEFTSEWITTNAQSKISSCNSELDLENAFAELLEDLNLQVCAKEKECMAELKTFFEENNLRHILLQWRGERNSSGKLGELSDFIRKCKDKAEDDVRKMKNSALLLLKRKSEENARKNTFLREAQSLANNLKDKVLTDELLSLEFDKIWKIWAKEFANKKEAPEMSIAKALERVLYEKMSRSTPVLRAELAMNPLSKDLNVEKLEHAVETNAIRYELLSINTQQSRAEKFLSFINPFRNDKAECQKDAEKFLRYSFQEIDSKLDIFCAHEAPFQVSFASQIVIKLKEKIKIKNDEMYSEISTESKCKYTMPVAFTAMVLVTVARYMNTRFQRMQKQYERKQGIHAILNQYHEEAYIVFETEALQTAAEVSLSKVFCSSMSSWLKSTAMRLVHDRIPNEIMQKFNCSKSQLITKILRNLAKQETDKKIQFRGYTSYINDASSFALSWIADYAKKKYFCKDVNGVSAFATRCSSKLEALFADVMDSANLATNDVYKGTSEQWPSIMEWAKAFCRQMQERKLALNISDLQVLTETRASNTDFKKFVGFIKDEEERILQEAHNYFRSTEVTINSVDYKALQSILEKLWGCKSQCPFCKEPCRFTTTNHDNEHMCIQHKPLGISGWRTHRYEVFINDTCNVYITQAGKFYCPKRQRREINKALTELDLVFLVQHTAKMNPFIERLRGDIKSLIDGIQQEHASTQIRLAIVGYGDRWSSDHMGTTEPLVIEEPFTKDIKKVEKLLTSNQAFVGGLYNALQEITRLRWKSLNRILVHFGNWPTQANVLESINFNTGGKPFERHLANLQSQRVQYYYCETSSESNTMIAALAKDGGSGFVKVMNALEISKISPLVLEAVKESFIAMEDAFEKGEGLAT